MLTTSRKAARARAYLRVDARTCVTVAVPACGRARGKVSHFDSNMIPRDEFFFKINLLSAVSVSSRHRLPRIAYARFSPPRMQPTHESRILLCLARRHVCPVSDVFRQLCAKDKEKNEWEQRRGVLRFKNWWRFRFSLLRW